MDYPVDNIRPAFIPKYFAPSSHTNSQAFQYLTPEVRISSIRGILSIFTLLFIFTLQPKWIVHYAPYFSLQVVASLLSRTCHVEHSRLLASAHAATRRCLPALLLEPASALAATRWCLPATLRTAGASQPRLVPSPASIRTTAHLGSCCHVQPSACHTPRCRAPHPRSGPSSASLCTATCPPRLTRRATRGRR